MRLTEKALSVLNTSEARLRLALALGCREHWITVLLKKNKPNGPLTTMSALKVIRKETGLRDSEILEEVPSEAVRAA